MASFPFSRADMESAARVFHKLLPENAIRLHSLEILADSLAAAHSIDAANWGITLGATSVRLNVGRGMALLISQRYFQIVCDERWLKALSPDEIERRAESKIQIERARFKTAPHAVVFGFEAEKLAAVWPLIEKSHLAFVAEAARGFASRAPQSPTWRDAHSSGVLALLRAELGREIPDPSYVKSLVPRSKAPKLSALAVLENNLKSRGLSFPTSHLAAFFTALSAKGLVILSGPSGVGKTALALHFAALLPVSSQGDSLQISPDAAQRGQIALPSAVLLYLNPPRAGESRAATVICDGAAFPAKLRGGELGAATLQLRGAARKWLAGAGELLSVESEWSEETPRPTFRLFPGEKQRAEAGSNHLFLPVRPDWRDEKALLGYFNPLGNRYEWTPFLRFLLRADAGFARGDGLAYFVILDEMNLARPEWYFADFLALLEAPRDEAGRTLEPLRFDFDPRATGELPPREIFLPPNLYFVGTINADESAGSLSPKVLDRAWVLEAPHADFRAYTAQKVRSDADFAASDAQKIQLLTLFTRQGRFTAVDKAQIAAQISQCPARREALASLNDALSASGAGFGFRAFDEIFTFCALAEQNGLFGSENDAFDCAVSLKIVPQLRGARGQVEGALKGILAWSQAHNLPTTASATQKSLAQLERDGFLP